MLGRYDAERARFRTYLRLCLDGFAVNARKAETPSEARRRRHHGAARFSSRPKARSCATSRRCRRTSTSCSIRNGCARSFSAPSTIFARGPRATGRDDDVRGVRALRSRRTAADERPTYAAIAARARLTATTVTNHLAAMRRQFRRFVLDRLRDLTDQRRRVRGRSETAARALGHDAAGLATRRSRTCATSPSGPISASATRSTAGSGAAAWAWSTPRTIARSIARSRSKCSTRVDGDADAARGCSEEAQILARLEHPGHRARARRRHAGRRPRLLRDEAGARRARSTGARGRRARSSSGSDCSRGSATPCRSRTRRASCIAT